MAGLGGLASLGFLSGGIEQGLGDAQRRRLEQLAEQQAQTDIASQSSAGQIFQQMANGQGGGLGGMGSMGAQGAQPVAPLQQTAGSQPPGGGISVIKGLESGGQKNPYTTIGAKGPDGDQPYGAYGIMGKNIPQWTKEILGVSLTPQQFIADTPAMHMAQDTVARTKFGSYVQQSGGDQKRAAEMWIGGPGGPSHPNARDALGTSVAGYGEKFAGAAGSGAQAQSQPGPWGGVMPLEKALAALKQMNLPPQQAFLAMQKIMPLLNADGAQTMREFGMALREQGLQQTGEHQRATEDLATQRAEETAREDAAKDEARKTNEDLARQRIDFAKEKFAGQLDQAKATKDVTAIQRMISENTATATLILTSGTLTGPALADYVNSVRSQNEALNNRAMEIQQPGKPGSAAVSGNTVGGVTGMQPASQPSGGQNFDGYTVTPVE